MDAQEQRQNKYLVALKRVGSEAGNVGSFSAPGTKLSDGYKSAWGVGDYLGRVVPAVIGGRFAAKRIYTWGVSVFKKASGGSFWQIASTDEGAGAIAMFLVGYLLMKFVPGATTERFVCGMVGRGSIVMYNTLARWFGFAVVANEPDPGDDDTGIDITRDVLSERPVPANQLEGRELDEALAREVGQLAEKSPEFRQRVSGGLTARVNAILDNEGRPPLEESQIHTAVVDLFRQMTAQ